MNRSLIKWFLTITGLSGIASLFLSFAYGVSPVEATFGGSPFETALIGDTLFFVDLWVLGVPFLLSAVISASVIRWNLTGRLSLSEQIITYLIGLSMMTFVISTNFRFLFYGKVIMPVIFSASLLIAGVFLVIRNHRIGKFRNLSPIMLMQTVYLNYGILCLIVYWGRWEIGAYFTVVTVIVYAVQMAWISCQKKTISAVKPQEL